MHFLYNIGIRLMQGYVAVAALFSAKLRARHRGDAQAFDALERCRGERYVLNAEQHKNDENVPICTKK